MQSREELIRSIEHLKKTEVRDLIKIRLGEFDKRSNREFFSELCFCILTANFNAEKSMKIQDEVEKEFLTLSELKLAEKLKQLGHRFPNTRAKYIVEARRHINFLSDLGPYSPEELRENLIKNVKGIGYKEASHFLRNIGYKDFAILDFHIIDLLIRHGLIRDPGPLTRKKYLKIEDLLRGIAQELDLPLGELDLYLWFAETGKILK